MCMMKEMLIKEHIPGRWGISVLDGSPAHSGHKMDSI